LAREYLQERATYILVNVMPPAEGAEPEIVPLLTLPEGSEEVLFPEAGGKKDAKGGKKK
jgi:hypothetical protein